MTVTPNIDTKALRELRDDACNLNGRSLMEVLHAQQKYERAIIAAAPALLDLADRAQEQAKEIEELRDESQRWIDRGAYYRNLAVEAGVKREALDNEDDARLVDLWESNQAERDALKAEVEAERNESRGYREQFKTAVGHYTALRARLGLDGFATVEEVLCKVDTLRAKLSASEREAERLTAEREDLLKSRDRVIAERNEQSGLRDKLIERMTASDETWSEALGNERKLRDASEREAERLREALTTIDEAFAEGGFFDDGFARSTIRAALRGEEAPRE